MAEDKEKVIQDAIKEAQKAAEKEEKEAAKEAEKEAAEESDKKETKASEKEEKKRDTNARKKDKTKEKIDELEDKVKRQLAEFENFRNRSEKEKTQMFDMGAKNVLEKILPVVDNFERGLATPSVPFADGMQMIYKQLMKQLEDLGVKPIEAIGKEFDPNFHNAVMQVESEEYETGFVAQELQKGYLYKDTVIRHSMVAVVS